MSFDADDRIRAELHSLEREIETKKNSITAASPSQRPFTPRSARKRDLSFSKFVAGSQNNGTNVPSSTTSESTMQRSASPSPFKKAYEMSGYDPDQFNRTAASKRATSPFPPVTDETETKSSSQSSLSRKKKKKNKDDTISPILYRRPTDPGRPTIGEIIQDLRQRRQRRQHVQNQQSGNTYDASQTIRDKHPDLYRTSSARSLNSLMDEFHSKQSTPPHGSRAARSYKTTHTTTSRTTNFDPYGIETSLSATDAIFSANARDESFLVWTLRSDLTKKTNLVNELTVKLREESLKNIELESLEKANFRLNERVKRHAEEIERLRGLLEAQQTQANAHGAGSVADASEMSGDEATTGHRRRRSSHRRTTSLAMAASLMKELKESGAGGIASAMNAYALDEYRVFLRTCVSNVSSMENELRHLLSTLTTSSIIHSRLTHLLHNVLGHKRKLELEEKSMEISHEDGFTGMVAGGGGPATGGFGGAGLGSVSEDEASTNEQQFQGNYEHLMKENKRLRLKEYEMMKELEKREEMSSEYERMEKRCEYLTSQLSSATDEKLSLRLQIEELEAMLNRTRLIGR